MKLTVVLLAVLTIATLTGCSSKMAESGVKDTFTYSYVGMEEDSLSKRRKAIFLLVNGAKTNVLSIAGTYQILDKDGKVIESDSFTKDGYPYLMEAGQKRRMPVLSGTVPSNAASARIEISSVRYK